MITDKNGLTLCRAIGMHGAKGLKIVKQAGKGFIRLCPNVNRTT